MVSTFLDLLAKFIFNRNDKKVFVVVFRDGWFFWCNCPRCSSPGELGAESSSLLCCQGNCQGVVRPNKPLNMDSTYRYNKRRNVIKKYLNLGQSLLTKSHN